MVLKNHSSGNLPAQISKKKPSANFRTVRIPSEAET
jgi:hypothetical protein